MNTFAFTNYGLIGACHNTNIFPHATLTAQHINKNFHIQSGKLNGKSLNRYWITHSEIVNVGVLELTKIDEPIKECN